jgi:hypothetical protein
VVVVAVIVPALGAQRFEVMGKRSGHDAVHGDVDDTDRWIGLVSISIRLCEASVAVLFRYRNIDNLTSVRCSVGAG